MIGRDGFSERLMAAAAALVVGWSASVACGSAAGPTQSGPQGGCYPGAIPVTCNLVRITIAANGPFQVSLNGITLSGFGATTGMAYNVLPGTWDITGTTWANTFTITLASFPSQPAGLVQSGSIASVTGPAPTVAACAVTYTIPAGGTLPQTFHATYAMAAGGTGC